ncbi:FKBP-type peptidyl-prolyl cis-trans isomerase [Candidatus Margulisiibacteriota bacterium]
MRYLVLFLICISVIVSGCQKQPGSIQDKQSYAIGQNIGNDIKAQNLELDGKYIAQGMLDALKGTSKLSTTDIKTALEQFQQKQRTKFEKARKELGAKNKKMEEAFFTQNKKQKNVVTLKSGLQYKIIKKGKGKKYPKLTDNVIVHYKGTLLDGRVFGDSYKTKQPATFKVNQLIKGWTEALLKMKIGDKWQLYIPANLAYGDAGAGNMIPPNSTLVFDMELLEIKK